MAVLEVLCEGFEFGGGAGVAAEVEAVVEGPDAATGTEGGLLEGLYVGAQEAALENRNADGALVGGESGGQAREGAAGAAGEGDDVGVAAQLRAEP